MRSIEPTLSSVALVGCVDLRICVTHISMYECYGDLQIMCKGIWSLRHRGLVYQGTPAMETTYPNIGK